MQIKTTIKYKDFSEIKPSPHTSSFSQAYSLYMLKYYDFFMKKQSSGKLRLKYLFNKNQFASNTII